MTSQSMKKFVSHWKCVTRFSLTCKKKNKSKLTFKYAVAAHFCNSLFKNTSMPICKKYLQDNPIKFASSSPSFDDGQFFRNVEEKNRWRINILGQDDRNEIYVLRRSRKKYDYGPTINLFQYQEDNFPTFYHINALSQFILPKYSTKKNWRDTYNTVCPICLMTHVKNKPHSCTDASKQKLIMPPPNSTEKFINYRLKVCTPLIGFFDFECINQKEKCCKCDVWVQDCSCELSTGSKVRPIYTQIPVSYAWVVIDTVHNKTLIHDMYCGPDAAKIFLEKILLYQTEFKNMLTAYKMIYPILTKQQQHNFYMAAKCYLCDAPFTPENIKALDHCHFSGKYLGAAHQSCNLNRQQRMMQIPFFAHNFTAYDTHPLLHAIATYGPPNIPLKILPRNSEKVFSLSYGAYEFKDSLAFLQCSLGTLTENLVSSGHKFNLLSQCAMFNQNNDYSLLLRKGVYPYEGFNSITELMSTATLPNPSAFFSNLTGKSITPQEYQHAQNVWQTYKIKSMSEYTNFYCMLDVILLAECFLAFRDAMFRAFSLDPAQCLTLSMYSYNAMLYVTKAEIQLLSDPKMYTMIQKGIRGGVSFINERFVKREPRQTELIYLDAVNLYGLCQSQKLPIGDFKFLSQKTITKTDFTKIDCSKSKGYILEVDLSYPKKVQDLHQSFPLAPENLIVTNDIISPYSQKALHACYSKTRKINDKKLTATFKDRKKYVLHIKNLQLYLQLGMKLKKIHRVISYSQSNFLRKYIMFCTKLRQQAKNSFEVGLFKLMSNACYGKFLENLTARSRSYFCRKKTFYDKYVSSPFFQSQMIFNPTASIVHLKHDTVTLKRPYAVGFCILEYAKHFMYDNYYNFFQPRLNNASVIFSDTDSLLLKVDNLSQDEIFSRIKSKIDFSNYPPEHKNYNTNHKAELGFFKNELKGEKIMVNFVGVRSKTYAYSTVPASNIMNEPTPKLVCKGVNARGLANLSFDHFFSVVKNIDTVHASTYNIQSKKHVLQVNKIRKVGFTSFDCKRYLLSCGIHSVPYGYFRLNIHQDKCLQCNPK